MEWLDQPLYRRSAYVLFGFVAFIVALMVTFPDGQVKQIAAVQIEHQLEKNMKKNYTVTVSDLDPWWLGVELEGLAIEERTAASNAPRDGASAGRNPATKKKKKSKKNPEAPQNNKSASTAIEIPSIGARLAPIGSMLNAGLSVRYHLGLGGGAVGGSYTRGTSAQHLSVELGEISLDNSPLLEQLTGIPTFGTLSGGGEFSFAVGRPVVTDGTFKLRGKKITIGPKKQLKLDALPMGHAKIPQINFGNLQLDLHVENKSNQRPTVVLDEFRSNGNHLQSQIWGTVTLANRIGRADMRLKSRVRFNPSFAGKHKIIQGLQRNEKFQNGKSDDWYGLVFWGRINNLKWKGAPTAAGGPKGQGGGNKGGGGTKNKKKKGASKGG